MKKYIITAFAFATLLTGSVTFTACEDIDEIQELNLNRLLSPTNLIGKISSKVNITASWDAMDGAAAYTIEFYKEDPNCEGTAIVSQIVEGTEFTKEGLDGETEYTIRVKSIAEGKNDSKWSVITRTTDITEQIFKTIEDLDVKDKQAIIKWTAGEAATEMILSWSADKKAQSTTLQLSEAELAAGQKTLTELLPSTEYEVRIKNSKKTRGIKTFTTKADLSKVTQVNSGDDLTAILDAAAEGAHIAIMDNAEYSIDSYDLTKSVTISGYYSSQRPTIHGRFTVGANTIKFLRLVNLILDGNNKVDNLLEITDAKAVINELNMNGCHISNLKKHFIYNSKKCNMDNIIINDCIIDKVLGSGGDGIDIRGGKLKSLTVSNSTFSNGFRTFLRCQSENSGAAISFTQCTFYNICTLDDSNNSGLFQVDKDENSTLTVTQCLFYGIGLKSPENKASGVWSKTGKMKATETYDNNYWYASPNLWTSGQSTHEKDADKVATEADPQFADAENGDFTVGNKELAGNEIGDPRWIK